MSVDTNQHYKFNLLCSWDKLSSKDHIGDASFYVKDFIDSAPQPDPVTGLYNEEDEDHCGCRLQRRLHEKRNISLSSRFGMLI
jgi:hypothetical protein